MRHVTGFFLALVMAVVLYAGAGWGAERLRVLQAHGASLLSLNGGLALGVLVGTGLLLGVVLVAPAVSALAPVLPGLALLAWSAYLAVSPRRAARLIPLSASHTAELGFRTLLTSGVLAVIGAVLIIPLFVPSRWRRRPLDDEDGFGRSSEGGLLQ